MTFVSCWCSSQIKVLQKPSANQPKPTVVMPPGMSSLGSLGPAIQSISSGSVPEAFEQLATAFMAAQGTSAQGFSLGKSSYRQWRKKKEKLSSPSLLY